MRTVKAPTGTACLLLAIEMMVRGKSKVVMYRVRFLDPHPEVAGKPAIRLTKMDGEDSSTDVYDLNKDSFGTWLCSCPDFVFSRRRKDPDGCKHLRAAKAVGLLKGER